jgi:hypothetical protein
MSIYVEIDVRAPLDALWAHTQTPTLHEQWDLRFSTSITFREPVTARLSDFGMRRESALALKSTAKGKQPGTETCRTAA